MRSFFYNLDKVLLDSQTNHNRRLTDFCHEVKGYVLEGSFSNYKKVKTILGYWGQPDYYVSDRTGIKEGTVRQARRNLSNELYELFGYDFFEVISIGDDKALREGEYRLYLAKMGYDSNNFLYRDLVSSIRMKGRVLDDIDVSTCKAEIQFLVRHAKQSVEREMESLNNDKLLYLIRMLDNEVDTPVNIRNLIKCFEKGV